MLFNQAEAERCAQNMQTAHLDEHAFAHDLINKGPSIIAITHGTDGVHVYTRERHYHGPRIPADTIDTVGAGDAFGSGFFGGLIDGLNIQDALTRGLHNSASVIAHLGAQTGLYTTAA